MVSTYSKVGVLKDAELVSKDVGTNQIDLAVILEGQAKMQ